MNNSQLNYDELTDHNRSAFYTVVSNCGLLPTLLCISKALPNLSEDNQNDVSTWLTIDHIREKIESNEAFSKFILRCFKKKDFSFLPVAVKFLEENRIPLHATENEANTSQDLSLTVVQILFGEIISYIVEQVVTTEEGVTAVVQSDDPNKLPFGILGLHVRGDFKRESLIKASTPQQDISIKIEGKVPRTIKDIAASLSDLTDKIKRDLTDLVEKLERNLVASNSDAEMSQASTFVEPSIRLIPEFETELRKVFSPSEIQKHCGLSLEKSSVIGDSKCAKALNQKINKHGLFNLSDYFVATVMKTMETLDDPEQLALNLKERIDWIDDRDITNYLEQTPHPFLHRLIQGDAEAYKQFGYILSTFKFMDVNIGYKRVQDSAAMRFIRQRSLNYLFIELQEFVFPNVEKMQKPSVHICESE